MRDIKEFAGKKFQVNDGSAIYFAEDGTFVWYQSDENHEDNFYSGEYQVYFDEDGVDYIMKDMPQLGFSEEKLDAFLYSNEESPLYQIPNFCCMVLENREIMADGECRKLEGAISYYMGFMKDGFYDAVNMQTHNYVSFTRV